MVALVGQEKRQNVKYFARVGANEYEVEMDQGQIFVNGEAVKVDLLQVGVAELYSVLFGGRSYDMLVQVDRFNYTVTFRGEQFLVQVEDERSRKLNSGRRVPAIPQGELPVKAPISGLIVKVLIEPGMPVEDQQALVILEAMKMENEIRSPRAGVIKSIAVAAGNRVEQNQPLLVLE
jgi:biotin carboxyl carrier protein